MKIVLQLNKLKLLEFFASFLPEKSRSSERFSFVDDDETFVDEKKYVISLLSRLEEIK